MDNVQLSFFYNYKAIVASSDFYRKYNAIFSALDPSSFSGANEIACLSRHCASVDGDPAP